MEIKLNDFSWSQRLKLLRTIRGWSQEEAARRCNTTQKVYWSWEAAERYPRNNSRTAIVKAFDVAEGDLFGDSSKAKAIS